MNARLAIAMNTRKFRCWATSNAPARFAARPAGPQQRSNSHSERLSGAHAPQETRLTPPLRPAQPLQAHQTSTAVAVKSP